MNDKVGEWKNHPKSYISFIL